MHPFGDIRLIAIDIDGTLADKPDAKVSLKIREEVARLRSYGVRVTVATGRALAGAKSAVDELGVGATPLIVYNGAIITDALGKRIRERWTMSASVVEEIVAAARDANATAWVYQCGEGGTQDGLVDCTPFAHEVVRAWAVDAGPSVELNGIHVTWNSVLQSSIGEAVAILIRSSPLGETLSLDRKLHQMKEISITTSGTGFIEIRPSKVSKATALSRLAFWLRLDANQTLTIGDNHNDIEMLTWAGIGVTVSNASQPAIAASDYTASRRSAEGVLETLRLVANARRYQRGGVFERDK